MTPAAISTRPGPMRFMVAAVITLLADYLVWAAFHDIMHGEADTTAEYAGLCMCVVGFAMVALWLFRVRYRVLAAICAVALAAGIWGQSGIGPGTQASWQVHYVAAAAAHLWFLALVVILLANAWIAGRRAAR